MRPSLQQEAKALGDPTRHRIFRYIAEAAAPVGVAELTDYLGLNHNAIRQHLAVLFDAQLVVEEVEGSGRPGRPRLLYRLRPEAAGTWDTTGPYEYLAALLSKALEAGETPRQVGRDAGQQVAVGMEHDVDPLDAVEEEMERRGFRPTRTTEGASTKFLLERCPFEDVAATSPDTVCQLHLGLVEGIAEGLEGLEVLGLAAEDPHRAGCRVTLHPSG